MKVALVHDWLTGMRGGEKVLDAMCELFPDAPLYTLVWVPGTVTPRIEARPIRTSIAQRLPAPGRFYRHYLPIYPTAVELFDLEEYDLVLSSSHCAVKSVVRSPRAVHVCYCHSPMRYAWDQFGAYFGPDQVGAPASRLLRPVMRGLARWDAATAGRVDRFLANSQYVAGRIGRYYNRRSTVVYPPVDTDFYSPAGRASSSAFLVVSALVPYKRVDLAIEACRQADVPLKIVGTGPERSRLEAMSGSQVEFLGWQSDEQIRALYRSSAATLLPGVEDFGIVPVEAQACGCPVVALDAGGARETVLDGVTGILVQEPTAGAFATALSEVARRPFDEQAIRANALRFSRGHFLAAFRAEIEDALNEKWSAGNTPRVLPQSQKAARENGEAAARMSPPQPKAASEDKQ
jgi:glycosyltransferase involved in cell wall biosynthesis